MEIRDILHIVGAISVLGYAVASLVAPKWVGNLLEHRMETGRGVTEFRVLHGGYLAGISIVALVTMNAVVFMALGWGWLGAAMVRVLAYPLDRPKLNLSFVGFFILEIALGIFLLV